MTIQTTGLFAALAPHKDTILVGAVAQAKQGGAQPTLDMVKTAAFEIARTMAADVLRGLCKSKLDVAVTMAGFTFGPRPVDLPVDEASYVKWRDDFDQHIMEALGEDVCRAAGQDWLGIYCTDSEVDHEPTRIDAANAMARNIVQASVLDRQPGQVLAEIGIVHDDLLKVAIVPDGGVLDRALGNAGAIIIESHARGRVEQLVGKFAIAAMGAGTFDAAKLTEVLNGAFDDDDFLPIGHIEALGGSQNDLPYFRAYLRAAGQEAIQNTVQAATMAALTGTIVEMPKDAPKPKKGKGKKSDTVTAVAVAPPPVPNAPATTVTAERASGDDDISDVIKLMLEHAGDGQEAIGELVGKSRAHINNVKNGKSSVVATPTQRKNLITRLQFRIDGLQTALARLT